jgi:hypothetical protein
VYGRSCFGQCCAWIINNTLDDMPNRWRIEASPPLGSPSYYYYCEALRAAHLRFPIWSFFENYEDCPGLSDYIPEYTTFGVGQTPTYFLTDYTRTGDLIRLRRIRSERADSGPNITLEFEKLADIRPDLDFGLNAETWILTLLEASAPTGSISFELDPSPIVVVGLSFNGHFHYDLRCSHSLDRGTLARASLTPLSLDFVPVGSSFRVLIEDLPASLTVSGTGQRSGCGGENQNLCYPSAWDGQSRLCLFDSGVLIDGVATSARYLYQSTTETAVCPPFPPGGTLLTWASAVYGLVLANDDNYLFDVTMSLGTSNYNGEGGLSGARLEACAVIDSPGEMLVAADMMGRAWLSPLWECTTGIQVS